MQYIQLRADFSEFLPGGPYRKALHTSIREVETDENLQKSAHLDRQAGRKVDRQTDREREREREWQRERQRSRHR